MANTASRRLSASERKAAILRAALALLGREGLDAFSLEAVAREANVALSLPRHYFGSYRGLLKAATSDLLQEVEVVLLDREMGLDLETRFSAYLELLANNPWGHHVWMRCEEIHPDIAAIVRRARRRMSEGIYRRPWRQLSKRERLDARGRIGYIEAVVSDWLTAGARDSNIVVELILQATALPEDQLRRAEKGAYEG